MKGARIGAFLNRWRGRRVEIFEDTVDPTMVYTTGLPIGPDGGVDHAAIPIETHEPKAAFAPYIGSYHKVYD